MNTVLITGANRGIGLEFCKQYVKQGWRVIACSRNPKQAMELSKLSAENSNIKLYKMDVIGRKGVDELANELTDVTIDLLIANAGIYGDSNGHAFGNLDYSDWIKTLETNVLGAIKTIEAFMPNLVRSQNPRVAVISSQMGSIADNGSGGSILYRSSKAALNAAMKSLAIDLQTDRVGVLIFHPGWVKTDMGGPSALIDAKTSVTGMVGQIDNFKISETGAFIKYDGTHLPW